MLLSGNPGLMLQDSSFWFISHHPYVPGSLHEDALTYMCERYSLSSHVHVCRYEGDNDQVCTNKAAII